MAKAKIWGNWHPENEKGNVAIFCEGCKCVHVIATKEPFSNGAIWSFNGDFEKPTFTPSLLITTPEVNSEGIIIPATCCHTFITDGYIDFLPDCTHSLRGKHLLPDIKPDDYE